MSSGCMYKHIGERIRDARSDRYTQEELAEHLGYHKGQISRWEAGKRPISLENLQRIAQFFGRPLS